eukprot:TRINITY_DN10712_c0_g1_i1.p1 TRINITY_DN10712_c0_g1~~TRINITY_DN10712_c0_g1_i1.p1  ORF type:complete len:117 (-),score=17.82 TRINITY_DN10712_c0_g1_i1:254-604(-)
MVDLYEKYRNKGIIILTVYIREAMNGLVAKQLNYEQPKTLNKKSQYAEQCNREFYRGFQHFLVDSIDNSFSELYDSWPFRIYGIKDNKIDFISYFGDNPYGYDINKILDWIKKYVD